MAKCVNCGKETNEFSHVLVSCDGDFACNAKCHKEWIAKMNNPKNFKFFLSI